VLDRPLDSTDVPRLYRAADAFVLPSHGEGWGRPYMEAMAMGLPTIGTRWSGNLEFMHDDNSYLIDYELADAAADFGMDGQRWAEPSRDELRRAMRRLYEHPDEAAGTGARARADVLLSCRPELVADAVLERVKAADRHPVHVSFGSLAVFDPSVAPARRRRPATDGRRLTACIVVEDNAPSLSQCVWSVRDVADSVVVVELKSDDDMAAARNDALDRATGSWILMLDATNSLDPGSIDHVRNLVKRGRFEGYSARVLRQLGMDGAISSIEDRTPVLFPRHPDLRYVGRVDEQLLPQGRSLKFRLIPSRVVINQHDDRPERHDPVARARRQLLILERAVREEPYEPFHLYNLGSALGRLGLHHEAEAALVQAVALAPPRAVWVPSAHLALARTLAGQGRRAEATKACKAATKLAPQWAQAWCMLAAALVDTGRLKAALRAYMRAVEFSGETWMAAGHPDDAAWQARAGMGRIHLACERYGEAAACLSGALALNPTSAELHVWLARAYEALGRSADARAHLERATMVARSGADAYAAFGDFFTKKAEEALLRGLADNPESRLLLERIERLRTARVIA
jgi:tetratricopeptide (TPR) repeat protein